EDDVAIESRLVSKTIESAQSRVEGFNFDIRKRVVEFDDVINKQRETIYAERDKVLRNEDLTETIRAFLDEDLDEIVERHLGSPNEAVTEEGLTDLLVDLGRMGLGADRIDHDELLKLSHAGEVSEHVRDVADALLEAKEAEVGAEAWATIERFVLLRTIDSLWVEHLTEIDDMRRGIGLRGYAQQDPLNEFRKEAFRLYEELSGFIRHQVASTIFRVSIQQPQQQQAGGVFAMQGPGQRGPGAAGAAGAARPGRAGARQGVMAGPGVSGTSGSAGMAGVAGVAGAGVAGAGAAGGQQARPGYTPSGAKIGRNDACWCGSGRKYKKCHGQ
ncbi:MAG TPA: SEC-C metal-binding domain-containing protein, partial [Candidatus Limnocylindrales bacterium]